MRSWTAATGAVLFCVTGCGDAPSTVSDVDGARPSDDAATSPADAMPGPAGWVRSIPPVSHVADCAVDATGAVVIAGTFLGTVNFGTGPLDSGNGLESVFVAKYAADGEPIWVRAYGTEHPSQAYGVVVDATNNIVVIGTFLDSIAFDDTVLTATGNGDLYIAKLRPNDGALAWAYAHGGEVDERPLDVALDRAGDVLVTGWYRGIADFGGGAVPGDSTNQEFFAAKYRGADGAYLWAATRSDLVVDVGYAIAADSTGNVIVTGGRRDGNAASRTAVSVTKLLGTNGSTLWFDTYSTTEGGHGNGIAIRDDDAIVVSGNFAVGMDIGGVHVSAKGGNDMFVAAFEPSGDPRWVRRFGGPGFESAEALAVSGSDSYYVVGAHSDDATWETQTVKLASAGSTDVTLLEVSGEGELLVARAYGAAGDDHGFAVCADRSARLAGEYAGPVDFDDVVLPALGPGSQFLLSTTGGP